MRINPESRVSVDVGPAGRAGRERHPALSVKVLNEANVTAPLRSRAEQRRRVHQVDVHRAQRRVDGSRRPGTVGQHLALRQATDAATLSGLPVDTSSSRSSAAIRVSDPHSSRSTWGKGRRMSDIERPLDSVHGAAGAVGWPLRVRDENGKPAVASFLDSRRSSAALYPNQSSDSRPIFRSATGVSVRWRKRYAFPKAPTR